MATGGLEIGMGSWISVLSGLAGVGQWAQSSFHMASFVRQLEGLSVRVDDVVYMPSLEAPDDRPHPFVYFLSIRNHSPASIVVRGRKWVVTENDGEVQVVEGDGVVGQFPRLEPGEQFSYNSYHVTRAGGLAEGAFFAQLDSGEWGYVPIPRFRLDVPAWA